MKSFALSSIACLLLTANAAETQAELEHKHVSIYPDMLGLSTNR